MLNMKEQHLWGTSECLAHVYSQLSKAAFLIFFFFGGGEGGTTQALTMSPVGIVSLHTCWREEKTIEKFSHRK